MCCTGDSTGSRPGGSTGNSPCSMMGSPGSSTGDSAGSSTGSDTGGSTCSSPGNIAGDGPGYSTDVSLCSNRGVGTCSSKHCSTGMTSDGALLANAPAMAWHARLDPCICTEDSVGRNLMMVMSPLYRHDVFIEAAASVAHVPKITEYECSVDIKSAGNNVLAVFSSKPL